MAERTISAIVIDNWQSPNSVELWILSHGNWTSADGTQFSASSVSEGTWFKRIAVTKAGTTLSIPSFTLPPTESSIDNPGVKLGAAFVRSDGRFVSWFSVFEQFVVPDDVGALTWEDLATYNAGALPSAPQRDVSINGDLTVSGDITAGGDVTADNFIGTLQGDIEGDTNVNGIVTADRFMGDGSGLTGIGSGTGGVINTGSTTIGADSGATGTGKVSIQTRGVERIGVENDGTIVFGGATTGFKDKGGQVYNVKAYGAIGDGTTNDTAAIQNAINAAGLAGGGTVYFPRGTYKVSPQASGEDVLYVSYDGIRLVGEGAQNSIISCYVFGGLDPDANWEVLGGAVWRGSGIRVQSPSGTRTGFRMENLRLTGNANHQTDIYPIDGSGSTMSSPANVTTGNGWDITHKGVRFDANKTFEDTEIKNCEVDGWRGEVVYYGGSAMSRILIENCRIHTSNASMISITGELTVRGCLIYDGEMGMECSPFSRRNLYEGNTFRDLSKGIVIVGSVAGTFLGTQIRGNHFRACPKAAIWVTGYCRQVEILSNEIVDCGTVTEEGAIRIFSQYGGTPAQVYVAHNTILADASTVKYAFYLSAATVAMTEVLIENNVVSRTAAAATAGRWVTINVRTGISITGWNIRIRRNYFNTQQQPQTVDTTTNNKIPLYSDNTYDAAVGIGSNIRTVDGLTNVIVLSERMTLLGNNSTYQLVPGITTDNIMDGQRAIVSSSGSGRGAYFNKTGTGYSLKAPRFMANAEMVIEYQASQSKWVEVSYNLTDKSKRKPTASDLVLSGDSLESKAPSIEFYGTDEIQLSPSSATTFSTFANAPEGVPLAVRVNANGTIQNSATLVLTGAANFAPGGSGGVITLFRPAGSTKLYEMSRFAL